MFCENCGESLKKSDKFCEKCGLEIITDNIIWPKEKTKIFRKITLILLSIVILAGIAGGIYYKFSYKRVEGVADINSKIIGTPKKMEPTNSTKLPDDTTTNSAQNDRGSKKQNQNNVSSSMTIAPNTPSTSTPTPAPQLDQFSAEKLKQKATRLLEAADSIYRFIQNSNAATKTFTITYLDSADALIDESVSYNALIKTNGPIAEDALSNCKQADEHFRNLVTAERGWAYYNLVENYPLASGALDVATSEHTKAYSTLNACLADLKSLEVNLSL
ncbi:MAG: hypothetical protein HW405_25 [Candidatus Berkelbacteria bacterium]|nr:hypothetical protein [Candidatus Berkelbacteria bacterium]